MKTIKFTMIALLTVFSIVGCKKEKEKTTAEKIQAKWNISSILESTVRTGQSTLSTTQQGRVGEYVDFRTDGKVYIKNNGTPETAVSYTIDSDTQITFGGETYQIRALTDNALVLYSKSDITGGYEDITINLNK